MSGPQGGCYRFGFRAFIPSHRYAVGIFGPWVTHPIFTKRHKRIRIESVSPWVVYLLVSASRFRGGLL